MIIKKNVWISSLKRNRLLHIYFPDKYKVGDQFPVLYMFDGHNLFFDEDATYGKSWGLKKYLDKINAPLIVVGIECNHEGNKRVCEFSPYSFQDNEIGNIKGEGQKLMKFMIKDLKKQIDQEFPTFPDREHTFIGGSSMGGLMAIYAGFNYPQIYSKAICISPYYRHVLKALKFDISKTNTLKQSSFYISFGKDEWNNKKTFARGVEDNLSIARLLTQKKQLPIFIALSMESIMKPVGKKKFQFS